MTNYVPRRTLLAWGFIVVLTCATWWIGISHFLSVDAVAISVLALAFVKVRFIGSEFMELRDAPKLLMLGFDVYVVLTFIVLVVWYLVA